MRQALKVALSVHQNKKLGAMGKRMPPTMNSTQKRNWNLYLKVSPEMERELSITTDIATKISDAIHKREAMVMFQLPSGGGNKVVNYVLPIDNIALIASDPE